MTVVSNTSPIINLACINRLDILEKLYQKIIIPPAVFEEITNNNQPGSNEVKSLKWFKIFDIENKLFLESLKGDLDEGEAEAISLSIQLKADLLLLDEKKGRNIASKFDIVYTGVLGILLIAKEKKLIKSVKLLMDELISTTGFWIDKKIYNHILGLAKEL